MHATPSSAMKSNSAELKRTRLDWIDYAKGIGIILVVYDHVMSNLRFSDSRIDPTFYDYSYKLITSFHMPLFFFLSGLFIEKSLAKGTKLFLVNKFNTIAYPYLVWSLIQGSLLVILSAYTVSVSQENALTFKTLPIHIALDPTPLVHLWFLYVLFAANLVFLLLKRLTGSIYVVFALAILIYLASPYAEGFETLRRFMSMFLYFMSGIVCAKALKQDLTTVTANLFQMNLGSLVIAAIGFVLFEFMILQSDLTQVGVPGKPTAEFFMALGGIATVLLLSLYCSKRQIFRGVQYLGFLSLPIYLAHILVIGGMKVILQKVGIDIVILNVILMTIAGLMLPIVLFHLTEKLKFPYLFSLGHRSTLSLATLRR